MKQKEMNQINHFKAGNEYFQKKLFDLAVKKYSQAILQNPNHADAYNNRGMTYQALNKNDLALQDYSKAIEFNPNDADAYYNRGNTYEDLNQYDLALLDYSKAIEFNPNYADAYNNRGLTYKALNKYDLALQDYSKAIEFNHAKAYYNRGNTYNDLNKYDLALQDYSKAIELNPNYATAYNNRGFTYKNLKKYDLALLDYQKAIKLQQNNPLFLANLGEFYFSQNDNQKAQDCLQKAQKNICDEPTMSRFQLSAGYLQHIKQKIELLQEIGQQINLLSNQFQELKKQKTLTPQQEKQFQKTQSELQNAFLNTQKNYQQEDINHLKNINKLLSEKNKEISDLKQRQENLEKQDHNVIAKILEDYKQLQNKDKQIYYRSFCPRLLIYLQACQLIETEFFQYNTDVALESNTEKLVNKMNIVAQKASPLLAGIPIVGSVIEVSLGIIDYGINCYKEKKFQDKVKNITAVIRSKSGVSSEIEREVQIASFEIIKKVTKEDLIFGNFMFQEQVTQIQQNEESQKIEFANSPYWKLGIDHSLRVLKFIEQDSQKILTEDKHLRDIILESINNQDLKGQSKKEVQSAENRDSGCCEIF